MTQEWRQLTHDEREGRAESPLVAQLAFSENPGYEPPLAIHAINSYRTGLSKGGDNASNVDASHLSYSIGLGCSQVEGR